MKGLTKKDGSKLNSPGRRKSQTGPARNARRLPEIRTVQESHGRQGRHAGTRPRNRACGTRSSGTSTHKQLETQARHSYRRTCPKHRGRRTVLNEGKRRLNVGSRAWFIRPKYRSKSPHGLIPSAQLRRPWRQSSCPRSFPTFPILPEYLPVPDVWSAWGPVPGVAVEPLFNFHSKS